jgi:hypothetical protein
VNIALFTTHQRIALVAFAVVMAISTIVAIRWKHGRLSAALGTGVLGAVGLLAAEVLVALTVRLAAPSTAEFNEYRWVFLSPWGRIGLALGGVAVLAIVGLAWRATRGAAGWRRALMIALRGGAAVAALVVFLQPAVELRQVAREPNRIAILVDVSRSMGLREDPSGPDRLERTRQLLAASKETLAAWERDHKLDYSGSPASTRRTTRRSFARRSSKCARATKAATSPAWC